jgi:type I restriction enzyme S subunit
MMLADLKPYPKYKDSTAPWLEIIPDHWKLERTKVVLKERVEKGYPNEPLLAATQTKGVVLKEDYENRTVLAMKDLHLLKLVRKGDFVISLRSFQGGIEYARDQGIISPAYTILYPTKTERHAYLARLFKSKPYVENLSLFVTGIRQGQNVDYEKLSRSALPSPPPDEQQAIARFLDHADRKIRKFIRAKQKLIKLLEEQKQAIIHQAVTRGLDPNVRLKPSGVEWLGNVPEHWRVTRLKWVTRLQRGYDLPAEQRRAGPYPVISSGGPIDVHCQARCQGPGVVMGRYGSTDAVFYVETAFWPHNTSLFVTDFQGNLPRWCFFMLRTISKADHAGKSAVPGVDRKDLYEIVIAVPPVLEQDALVHWIEAETAQTDRAIASARGGIDLVRELRARLFADVVTGKLDVRDAAAALPDEPVEALEDVELEPEGVEGGDPDATETEEVEE